MALSKTVVNDYGIPLTYHKISRVEIHKVDEDKFHCLVVVNSYPSKSSRDKNEYSQLMTNSFSYILSKEELNSLYSTIYAKLKLESYFDGSIDN